MGPPEWGREEVVVDRKGDRMNEDYYPRCRVWAAIAWAVTVALVVAAWAVLMSAPGHWRLGFLLGGSGCAMSAVAATVHIRSFMVRVCSLVRAASHAELPNGLRPVS